MGRLKKSHTLGIKVYRLSFRVHTCLGRPFLLKPFVEFCAVVIKLCVPSNTHIQRFK